MQVTSAPLSRVAPPAKSSGAGLLALVATAVVACYAWIVAPSRSDWGNTTAGGAFYNLLIDGLKAGQLSLKVEAPAGLAALPDPYDPQANRVYRTEHHLHDTSFFKGKIYLYYGITPALVVFGPYHLLTGDYLYNKQAAFAFAALGYLASVLLLHQVWRRYFAETPAWIVAGCAVALGLANSIPGLLATPAVCEVAIGAAYAFVMLACLGVWQAIHAEERRHLWLAFASAAYGLAVGARPSVLFGAVLLLAPVLYQVRCEPRQTRAAAVTKTALAAIVPIALIGIGLAAYNYLRFGSILEFGQRYQLAGDRQDNAIHFSAGYLAFNAWLYFLKPVVWTSVFPFVREPVFASQPAGHAPVEGAYGIFSNTPVALFALAALFGWRRVPSDAFRWSVGAIIAVFATSALVLCLFYGTVLRYQAEFHPPLVLVACVGVLALDRFAATARIRRLGRTAFAATLLFSVAFAILASIRGRGEELNKQAVQLAESGRRDDAIAMLERAVRTAPNVAAAHSNLAVLQLDAGNAAAAATHFERALRVGPATVDALNGLGRAYAALGRLPESADQFRRAIALRGDFAHGHLNLATVLFHRGQFAEAASHYQRAIELGLDTPEIRQALQLAQSRAQSAARP